MTPTARHLCTLAAAFAAAALPAAGCGPASAPAETRRDPRPNVILISIDSLRSDHLSSYGYERSTSPNLDRLAREGVLFESHISSTSWTLPAHAALFTSLPDSVHGCTDTGQVLPDAVTTLAERFAAAGYRTAGFFAGPYLHPAFGLGQGFEHYENCTSYARTLDATPVEMWAMDTEVMRWSHADVTNPTVLAAFERWLNEPRDRRFFCFVHLWDVHFDYIPPPPYDTMFDPDYTGSVSGRNFFFNQAIHPQMPQRDLDHLLALYDGEIAWTDEHLGRMVAALEKRKLLDDTIIAVTSDHGTAFFEHNLKGHRNSLFDELIRVPLVVRFPRALPAGARVTEQTRAIDVGPTLLELAGLPEPSGVMGRSLVALAAGGELDFDNAAVSELFSVGQRARTLRTPEWKFYDVMSINRRYWTDLAGDPQERALRPAGPEAGAIEERYLKIAAELAARAVPAGSGRDPADLPDDVRRQLEALGYVGEH